MAARWAISLAALSAFRDTHQLLALLTLKDYRHGVVARLRRWRLLQTVSYAPLQRINLTPTSYIADSRQQSRVRGCPKKTSPSVTDGEVSWMQ